MTVFPLIFLRLSAFGILPILITMSGQLYGNLPDERRLLAIMYISYLEDE